MIQLRPQEPLDLPLLAGGESPFDEFGPRGAQWRDRAYHDGVLRDDPR